MKAKLTPPSLLIYDEYLIPENFLNKKNARLKGSFEKKILIITDPLQPDSEEEILLGKMLKATGLSTADIHHLEYDGQSPLLPFINQLAPQRIICFGNFLESASIRFQHKLYKTIQINNYQMLVTHSLQEIAADASLKQALWNGLKKMFDL